MKRSLLAALLVLPVMASLTPPSAAADKFTLILDWFVNPDHAPLIVAQKKGFFKAAGLEVEMIEPSNPSDPPRLVAAGRGDMAISYQPNLHILVDKGLPLVRVGTLVATPLNSVVVLRGGTVKSIRDLKGKKVGYSVAGTEQALLGAMLEKYGLSLKDVTLVNVNFNLSTALMSGRVDAVVGAFRNFELNQLDIEKRPGRAFYPEEHGVPVYDELIAVVKKDRAGDPVFAKFLAAWEQGVIWLLNHPEQSWKLFIAGHEKKRGSELFRRAWRDTLPRFATRPAALDRRRYAAFAKFLKAKGLIRKIVPVNSYATEVGGRK